MPVALTRTVGFWAVHRLYRTDWTAERNREAFGPLSEPPGHPHDYRCAVTVTGPLDQPMGMVIDLTELDRILQEEIVAPLDGSNLNQDVADFAQIHAWRERLKARPAVQRAYAKGREVAANERSLALQ